jgi:ubiquinone/menaquinone biosynthesis C-methylase UbiE
LAIRAARRGATVEAIDINSQMLAIATQRAEEARAGARISFVEQGVAELDVEPGESYDVATCGLCFSELSTDELLRVLPFSTKTGLIEIGDPDRRSPVLLTGNFRLTVERVKRGSLVRNCA